MMLGLGTVRPLPALTIPVLDIVIARKLSTFVLVIDVTIQLFTKIVSSIFLTKILVEM